MDMSLGGFIAGPNETPDNPLEDDASESPISEHLEKEKQVGKLAPSKPGRVSRLVAGRDPL
jgi:hypothetical protein